MQTERPDPHALRQVQAVVATARRKALWAQMWSILRWPLIYGLASACGGALFGVIYGLSGLLLLGLVVALGIGGIMGGTLANFLGN